MKRVSLLTVAAAASLLAVHVNAPAARACQYCRMALEDPETARMITDNKGGSFPLDGAIGQYQAAPPSADLKQAPDPGSVATSASALAAAAASSGAPAPVARHAAPPPPAPVKPAVAPAVPVAKAPPAPAVNRRANAAVAHWTDLCLLGLVAAGGVFCWRTRRPASPPNP